MLARDRDVDEVGVERYIAMVTMAAPNVPLEKGLHLPVPSDSGPQHIHLPKVASRLSVLLIVLAIYQVGKLD